MEVYDNVILGCPHFFQHSQQAFELAQLLVAHDHIPQKRMPDKQALIPLAHQKVDGSTWVMRMQFLQNRRRQDGVADKGRLDDEDLAGWSEWCLFQIRMLMMEEINSEKSRNSFADFVSNLERSKKWLVVGDSCCRTLWSTATFTIVMNSK